MTEDSEKESKELTFVNSSKNTSRIRAILSIALVILFIISSLFLMVRYSLNVYNGVLARNATATIQAQTAVAENATIAPSETAQAATAEAVSGIVSQMTATAIAKTNATAVAKTNAAPISYPPTTDPVINDPLTGNNEENKWEETSDFAGNCGFSNGTYQIKAIFRGYFEYCLAKPEVFTNFIYEAQLIITQGDGGGLIIRADNPRKTFYYFLVNQDGTYEFRVFDLVRNVNGTLLISGSTSPVLNSPNTIAVAAINDVFQLYVNHHRIAVVGDNSFGHGFIGLFANYKRSPTIVEFQKVKVWTE